MNEPLASLEGVVKRYGDRTVLRQLSFDLFPGEILGLLGPNGSGKTTTIRLMTGVIRPDGGSIGVAGLDPLKDGDTIRRRSGVLTESAAFYLNMSGLENLRFFADLYGVTDPDRPLQLLAQFGLEAHRKQKVGTYSTGMKKRLGLAKALLHRPDLLFLDEPTNGLDPEGIRLVLSQIRELNQRDGTTIIICSHLLQQLETVCHRYLFLDGGQVIEQGSHAELEAKYGGAVTLQVETDLAPDGESFAGLPVQRVDQTHLAFALPGKQAVPDLLRRILTVAPVYGATITGQDLESLYFKIREANRHE